MATQQHSITFRETAYEGRDLTGLLGYEVRLRRPRSVMMHLDHSLAADAGAALRTSAAIAAAAALDSARDALAIRLIGAGQPSTPLTYRLTADAAGEWTLESVTDLLESEALQDAQLFHPDAQYSPGSAYYVPMTLDAVQYLGYVGSSAPSYDTIHLVLQHGARIGDLVEPPARDTQGMPDTPKELLPARSRARRSVLLLGTVVPSVRAYADAMTTIFAGDVAVASSAEQAAAAMSTLLQPTRGSLAAPWTVDGVTAGEDDEYTVELDPDDYAGPVEIIWSVREDGELYPPSVTAFTADPEDVPHTGSCVLTWSTEGADSVTLERSDGHEIPDGQPTSGTLMLETLIRPSAEEDAITVTLTATNEAGESVESVTLTIGAAADQLPPALSFVVSDELETDTSESGDVTVQVPVGTRAVVAWSSALTDEMTITPGGPQPVTNRRAEGSLIVTGAQIGDRQQWILLARSRNGQSVTRTVVMETVAAEVIDDNELLPGLFAYVTLAEAEAFCLYRLGSDVWTAATELLRKQALVTATRAIDRQQRYQGVKTDPTQRHAWPRTGARTYEGAVDAATVPQSVRDACCEEALARLVVLAYDAQIGQRNERLILGVKREKIGEAETEYFDPKNESGGTSIGQRPDPLNDPSLQSAIARELLAPYMLRIAGRVIL